MNPLSLTEQLHALHDASVLAELQPDEFCVRMLMRVTKCQRSQAERTISHGVADGKVEAVGFRSYEGKRVQAYRFTKPS